MGISWILIVVVLPLIKSSNPFSRFYQVFPKQLKEWTNEKPNRVKYLFQAHSEFELVA